VELEDLYAPYRPKRRTKAMIAREAGLEPLADRLLANPALDPVAEALKYISADKGVENAKASLEGARSILIERMAEQPQLVGTDPRAKCGARASSLLPSSKGKEAEGAKFADYFEFDEPIRNMPSHRALACCAARRKACSRSTSTCRTTRRRVTPPSRPS
jgi:uncharacterized protein